MRWAVKASGLECAALGSEACSNKQGSKKQIDPLELTVLVGRHPAVSVVEGSGRLFPLLSFFAACRLANLQAKLQREGLIGSGEDAQQVTREEMLDRRLQHLESVIEGHVAHIIGVRESVQRVAGERRSLRRGVGGGCNR